MIDNKPQRLNKMKIEKADKCLCCCGLCCDKMEGRKVKCWMKNQLLVCFSLQELKVITSVFITLLKINLDSVVSRYW